MHAVLKIFGKGQLETGYAAGLMLILCNAATGEATPKKGSVGLNYEDHIRPIFQNACFSCHNPDKKKGDLDLTNYSAMMQGGGGGTVVAAGEIATIHPIRPVEPSLIQKTHGSEKMRSLAMLCRALLGRSA